MSVFLLLFQCFVLFSRNTDTRYGGACALVGIDILQVVNCTFTNNRAKEEGGALALKMFSHVQISSCQFSNNTALYGGVIFSLGRDAIPLMIQDSNFLNNIAKQAGGALYLKDSSGNLSHVAFHRNKCPVASAIYVDGKGCILMTEEGIFSQNNLKVKLFPSDRGSAIFVHSAIQLLLSNTTFHENKVGGAIMLLNTNATINNCTFLGNSGTTAGALVVEHTSSKLVIKHSSFVGNRGPFAAAMSLSNNIIIIQSCNFADNVGMMESIVIDVNGRNKTDTRFYNSVFHETKRHSPLETVMSLSRSLPSVTVYLWKTTCQFGKHEVFEINKTFLHNASMPKFVLSDEGVNKAEVFSPFASGEFLQWALCNCQLCLLWRENVSEKLLSTQIFFICAVSPLPCLDGCLCYYSVDDEANTVDCSFNNMTHLPDKVLQRTEQLNMSGNHLDKLEITFEKLLQVRRFDFQKNNIRYIDDNSLKNLPHWANTLDLRSNKLTRLSTLFQTQMLKTKLWLSNNPFDCNCDMVWMTDWLQNATNIMDKENITCGAGKWKGRKLFQPFHELICKISLQFGVIYKTHN